MAFKIPSGSAYTTTSQGTGDLLLNGDEVDGRASLKDELAVNDTSYVLVEDGAGTWEVVAATRLGSADRIRRDSCLMNSSGGTDLIDWPAGTKVISAVIPGEVVALASQENTFADDQHFAGYKVTLNAGQTTYVQASTQGGVEVLDFYVNGALTARLKEGELRLLWSDAGATDGPGFVGDRASATPAAGDDLSRFIARGRDSGGNSTNYFEIRPEIGSPTDGAESGKAALGVIASATWQPNLHLESGKTYVPAGINFYVGKGTGDSGATTGVEVAAAGQVFVARAGAMAYFNRLSSDGTAVQFRRAGTDCGRIDVTTTSVGFVQPSDERLKYEVASYTDAGALLDALDVVTWLWRADGSRGWGLIAQALQPIRPDLVTEGSDGYLGVRYEGLIPALLAEVKALRQRVAALEAAE